MMIEGSFPSRLPADFVSEVVALSAQASGLTGSVSADALVDQILKVDPAFFYGVICRFFEFGYIYAKRELS